MPGRYKYIAKMRVGCLQHEHKYNTNLLASCTDIAFFSHVLSEISTQTVELDLGSHRAPQNRSNMLYIMRSRRSLIETTSRSY